MDHPFPMRLIAASRPFDFRPAVRDVVRRQAEGRPVADLVDVLLPSFRFLDAAHDLLTVLATRPYATFLTGWQQTRPDLPDDLWQAPLAVWMDLADQIERDVLPMLDLVTVLMPSLRALMDCRPDAAPHPADALANAAPPTRAAFMQVCQSLGLPGDPEALTGADWLALAQILTQTWVPLGEDEATLRAIHTLIAQRPAADQVAPRALATASTDVRDAFMHLCQREVPALCGDPHHAPAAAWMELAHLLEREVWHLPYLDDMLTFYGMLEARETRSATYLLLTWEPDTVDPEDLRVSLAHLLRRRVHLLDRMPVILRAPYTLDEGRSRLVPARDGDPFMRVLRSYAMNTVVDATVLHPLMDLDGDVTIAVDIQTLDSRQAQFQAETQRTAAEAALRHSGTYDPGTEARRNDAERVLREVNTQGLHRVQIAILVHGDSEETLRRNCASVRDRMGTTLRTEAVAGAQGEQADSWAWPSNVPSVTPRPRPPTHRPRPRLGPRW